MLRLHWAGRRSPILQTDLLNASLRSLFLECKDCAFTVILWIRAAMEVINEMLQCHLVK